MDIQKIVKALTGAHAAVRVPLDMIEVSGVDVLAGQEHVTGLLCPKRVRARHDEIVLSYGERDDYARPYHFSVSCGDVCKGESVVTAIVEKQLLEQQERFAKEGPELMRIAAKQLQEQAMSQNLLGVAQNYPFTPAE